MNKIKNNFEIRFLLIMEIDWKDEILYKDLVMWGTRLKREAPFFQEILQNIQKENIRILDVSCGTGDHLVMFAKWGFTGIGIDISEQNIQQARILAQRNNCNDKADFILGDILELESKIPNERFDFILCIGNTLSIFNITERKNILNQMINLLSEKGVILIQVVNYLSHRDEEHWFYNPSLKRDSNGALLFHVRMMEWKNKYDKITMYVQKIHQGDYESEEFDLHKKRTEFFVISENDFREFTSNEINLKIFGDYQKNDFKEKESNDLVIILKKD